jgi:hypothetical protein
LLVALEVADHVIARHESVWVVALVAAAGQLKRPIRRIKVEAVPALAAPTFGDAFALDDDVLAPLPGYLIADGKASLPAPNDDEFRRDEPRALPSSRA